MHTLLVSLNVALGEREAARDAASAAALLDERLVYRTAGGAVLSKEEYLARFDDPSLGTLAVDTDVLRVAAVPLVDDLAEVECLVRVHRVRTGEHGPVTVRGMYRNVRVWVRRAETWRLVGWFDRYWPS